MAKTKYRSHCCRHRLWSDWWFGVCVCLCVYTVSIVSTHGVIMHLAASVRKKLVFMKVLCLITAGHNNKQRKKIRHVDHNIVLNKRYFALKMISLKWYWHYNCITWTLEVWFIHTKAIHTFKCTWKIWTNKTNLSQTEGGVTFLSPVMLIHLMTVCALCVCPLCRFPYIVFLC